MHHIRLLRTVTAILVTLPAIAYAQDSTHTDSSIADTVKVKEATGGTTFTTEDGRTIALLGLSLPDSPAVSATDAQEHLATLIEGKTVVLVTDSPSSTDTKKAALRYVYVGSSLVNLKMLEDGYAAVSTTEHSLADAFAQANNEATSNHRGAYATERSTAVQCSATTKKGTRCKRRTKNLSGKCWQHE